MTPAIRSFQDEAGHTPLSNFWPAALTYDGDVYPTLENYFQAMKVQGDRARFQRLSPARAKYFGRRVDLRPDWEEIKLAVMTHGVALKFQLGTPEADYLLSTGDAYLEEGNTWGDRYWGTVNGVGENWLGLILMRRREQLRREVDS